MAFKPALCELHKKHPVCTKIGLFEIENGKKFSGEGAVPPPQTLPPVGRGTPLPTPPHGIGPLPTPHPLVAFGASILSRLRRFNLAFSQFFF